METLLTVVSYIIVFYFGWKIREEYAIFVTQKLIQQIEMTSEQSQQDDIVEIFIEKHGDNFFVYDAGTSSFLVQASCRKEVETKLLDMYPGKSFACTEKNIKEVDFK